jgi:hypothetical protein
VANEQGSARLRLQSEHVLTLFDDAVITTLRTTLATAPTLDGVDREVFGEGARERGVVAGHGEYARNHKNRWPGSHGEIANPGPIPGAHAVAGPDRCHSVGFALRAE